MIDGYSWGTLRRYLTTVMKAQFEDSVSSSLISRFLILLSIGSVGCFSLSPEAQKIQFVMKADPPKNCLFVGQVNTKTGTDGLTVSILYEDDVTIILRNRVAKRGGNFLVIDTITSAPDENGVVAFTGLGRGFQCANLKPEMTQVPSGAFDVKDTKIPPIPDP